MPESTRHVFEAISGILLRCWLFGFVLLLIWLTAVLLMGEVIHKLHGSLFGLSGHELDVILYCFMGSFKLLVLAFFFIPWLSIRLVLRKSGA